MPAIGHAPALSLTTINFRCPLCCVLKLRHDLGVRSASIREFETSGVAEAVERETGAD